MKKFGLSAEELREHFGPDACAFDPCDQPARAQVQWVNMPEPDGLIVALVVRGLPHGDQWSLPYCLDHAHWLLDTVLMKSLPEPSTDKEP